VETEAYLGPHDLAAHSSKGNTQRTKILFDKAGRVYVYLIYGIHILMNITTGPAGAAVLLRALEPIENITGKTNGPGSLTKSLGIDLSFYGVDVTDPASNITVHADATEQFEIIETTRIGVDYAGVWAAENLRYYIKDNPYVSKR
jgi:DNA-3-methyladenine glycosylase